MKRRILLTLAVLISVTGFAIILAQSLQVTLPPQAQAVLARYVSSENAVTSRPVIVRQLSHAARPGRFAPAYGAASVSGAFYFRTTRGYRDATTPNSAITATSPLSGITMDGAREGRALPFPPRDLWCVMLAEDGGKGRVIYLAQHEDWYNAEWIVHEGIGSPGDADLAAHLREVGCDLRE